MAAIYKFKPYNVGRWVIWSLFALVLLAAPLVFTSNLSVTMLAQMGIAIIACLSYNILLGQGGMLSFGHAVYTGLGSYMAIHALNAVSGGKLHIPVSLLPWALPLDAPMTGNIAAIITALAGLLMSYYAFRLVRSCDTSDARKVMFTSFFYLPVVQLAYVMDKLI